FLEASTPGCIKIRGRGFPFWLGGRLEFGSVLLRARGLARLIGSGNAVLHGLAPGEATVRRSRPAGRGQGPPVADGHALGRISSAYGNSVIVWRSCTVSCGTKSVLW